MNNPDVIIIYLPSDGQAHMIGAHKRTRPGFRGEWMYSNWAYIPATEVSAFTDELKGKGYFVIDERANADKQQPGMSVATPVICVHPSVTVVEAVNAFAQLHQAILDSED